MNRIAQLDPAQATCCSVALNIFTNYVNNVARTVVDFPEVAPGVEAETACESCA